ncbi:hypothetical protein HMPREF0673_01567, partial [Leyella stercorea DSM 18206]
RNLIGWRTESDWAAYGIWSGGGRSTMVKVVLIREFPITD